MLLAFANDFKMERLDAYEFILCASAILETDTPGWHCATSPCLNSVVYVRRRDAEFVVLMIVST